MGIFFAKVYPTKHKHNVTLNCKAIPLTLCKHQEFIIPINLHYNEDINLLF
jgi:hypothetical protein